MDYGSLFDRSLPNTLASVIYNGILTSNLLLEASYAQKDFAFVGSGSPFRDRINGTLMVDQPTGRRYWTSTFCGVCTDEERNNDAVALKGTYHLSTRSMGSHSIAVGGEDYAETRLANNHQSGSDFRILSAVVIDNGVVYPRLNDTALIQWNPIFSFSTGTDLRSVGVFVNDRWDLNNHLSFNLGVRYDMNDGKDADGNLVSDDSEISPRFGAQYDLRGDGRHRFNANYGRYVTKVADGNVGGFAQAAGNPSNFQWRYRGPAVNAAAPFVTTDQALQILWAWFDSVGGTDNKEHLSTASVSGLAGQIPSPISSPSVDEFTIGYSLQISNNAFVRTDLVSRNWNNFYAQRIDQSTPEATDQFGNRGDVAWLENDQDLVREYQGVQLQAQWRPGRVLAGGTYTWSELTGNDDGEAVATATSANTPVDTYYPEFLGYANRKPEGNLPEDVTHRARAWLSYEMPIPVIGRLGGSILHTFESGQAYSALGVIDATGRTTGTAYTGLASASQLGYTLSQAGSQHNYFFSERGEFRTDDYNRTDVSLMWNLPLWQIELFAQALVTNVLDNDSVTRVDLTTTGPDTTVFTRRSSATRGLSPFNPFTQTPVECPQGANAATCTSLGAHWQKGENFGKPIGISSYQLPLTYSFTAGVRF